MKKKVFLFISATLLCYSIVACGRQQKDVSSCMLNDSIIDVYNGTLSINNSMSQDTTTMCRPRKFEINTLTSNRIKCDTLSITKILSEKSGTTIKDIIIDDTSTPWEIRTGPSEGMTMKIPCTCLCVTYGPLVDNGNSGFTRTLCIPLKYISEGNLAGGEIIYYNDRWNGQGPHFDTQGGTMHADRYIINLVKSIRRKR